MKILGGEVEKLSIENAFENVLLKALGRPINPTPKLEYQGMYSRIKLIFRLVFNSNYVVETVVVQQNKSKLTLPNVSTTPVVSHNPSTAANIIHDNDDDDELFSNLDIDLLNTNVAASHSNHTDNFMDDDDDIFFQANIPDTVTVANQPAPNNQDPPISIVINGSMDVTELEAETKVKTRNEEPQMTNNTNIQQPPSSVVEFFDPDLDAIFCSDSSTVDDFKTFSNDITDSNYEFKISGCPLVTIPQLHSIDDGDKSEKSFIVKCEISGIVQKLRVIPNRYQITVLLKDSTDMQLEVISH